MILHSFQKIDWDISHKLSNEQNDIDPRQAETVPEVRLANSKTITPPENKKDVLYDNERVSWNQRG